MRRGPAAPPLAILQKAVDLLYYRVGGTGRRGAIQLYGVGLCVIEESQ